jgi:Peptidase family M23
LFSEFHRAAPPPRFAIDFYKLDDQHRTWIGNPKKLSSYLSYQQPIIAAAAGTVVHALDGLPNNPALPKPPPIPPIEETVGNHVIVEIGPNTYVLYAHMDPGSVKVRVGQHVEKGQERGVIGTSGNSTTPHVHFQLLSTPTFFPSNSLPYVFDQFDLLAECRSGCGTTIGPRVDRQTALRGGCTVRAAW